MSAGGVNPVLREHGFVKVIAKEGVYSFALHELDDINMAIETGAAWFVGDDCYGARIRVRLCAVESVIGFTPASIRRSTADDAALAAEQREERQREGRREDGEEWKG
jgi:hypothetical protein